MKLAFSAALIGAITLAGCTDPYEGAGQRSQNGAVIGALIGGAVGASSSDDKLAKAVVGAAVGGAIGGAIGADMDRQAADLRRDLGDSRIRIVNTGKELIVSMPQDILFSVDSTTVRSDLRDDLFVLADSMNDYPNTTIEVVGHTDNQGTAAYNQNLSERRASAVGAVLRSGGVSGSRIVTQGYGESRPIASNATAAGQAQNRRVDIVIRPRR